MARGTKSEAKAKKAGTSATSTKAATESVSPNPTLVSSSGQSGESKSPIASGNPAMRAAQSPGSKAVKSTVEQPAQGSISPLAAVSSPKSVSSGGNPKGVTSLSVEVIESGSGKVKAITRKTPSPGKGTVVSSVPPPPRYTSRKTPSPGKTGSPKLQQHAPLKVDVELVTKGRKTPSPNVSRKTPSPNVGSRSTSSPNVRKTPSPNISGNNRKAPSPHVSSRKTPSPNVSGRKTPSPNMSGRKTPTPNVSGRKTPIPNVSGRKTPSPNVRKTPSPNVAKKMTGPNLVAVTIRKTPSPNKVASPKPGPSPSPKPVTSPKSANPKLSLKSSAKGTGGTSTAKGSTPNPKPSSSKDGKPPKAKLKKSSGATTENKNKIAAGKTKKKSDKIKMLKSKDGTSGTVTKKIKKKNLKNIKQKLKVVLGLHTKSAKLTKPHVNPIKKPPSPPKTKSPIQMIADTQSPRALVMASPKKLTPSPSGGKPRPRIDDIARRLSIENRERREEKRLSGTESPGLFKEAGNGKKDKNGDSRRNSREKEVKAMKIKMVPVVCPWSWKGSPEMKPVSYTVSIS